MSWCVCKVNVLHSQDSPDKLAKNYDAQPLHFLIPKLLTFFAHAQPDFRKHSVGCVNHFVVLMPPALVQYMDQYLQGLFAVATDPSPDVRRSVCQALVMLLDTALEMIAPHVPAIVQYMLVASADVDATVALEACELSVSEASRHWFHQPDDVKVIGDAPLLVIVTVGPPFARRALLRPRLAISYRR